MDFVDKDVASAVLKNSKTTFFGTKNTDSHVPVEQMFVVLATLDRITELTTMFEKYRNFYGETPNFERSRNFLTERMEKKESVAFMAVDAKDGVAMGFIQLYPLFSSTSTGRIWLLNDLYVSQEYRCKGVATSLLEVAKKFAIDSKAIRLELETGAKNTTAQALYHKEGYKVSSSLHYSLELAHK